MPSSQNIAVHQKEIIMNASYSKTILATAAVTAALLGPVKAMAAIDMFLDLKSAGIEGESTNDQHANEIVILSWSWGARGTAGTKKGIGCVNDLVVTKLVDKATGPLIVNTITGAVMPTAKLTMRRTTSNGGLDFLVITMTNVTITSYQTGGSAGTTNFLGETVSLQFDTMNGTYTLTKSDGSPGATVPWSINNTGC